jgi:hypothetical protein
LCGNKDKSKLSQDGGNFWLADCPPLLVPNLEFRKILTLPINCLLLQFHAVVVNRTLPIVEQLSIEPI